ncbi:MAG: M12 family metallo-peptidase [Woeseiaceae bacterium]
MNAIKRLSVFATLALTMSLTPTLSVAEIVVSHFEPLQKLNVSSESIRFDALGKQFDLRLETNERVLAGLDSNIRTSGVNVYRGQLAGKPASWARIVVYAGVPSGIIWDGQEMFAIEAPGDSALGASTAVVYRLSDSHIAPGTMSCGTDFLKGNTASVLKSMRAATKKAVANAPGAISEITMSAIGDYEFTNARGSDAAAAAAITTRLNNVDGFFSEQVGVQINVQLIETHSDPMDPFGDTLVADELLDEVSEYRLQNSGHSALGLTHMYTGRNFDTTTVGIAWRGTLCLDYFGAGVSEGNGGALNDSLVAAHEIGHNFGAQHDGEAGSACEAETGPFLMSPSINGSQTFSACSIGIMQAEAAAASCVVPLPAVDVSVRPQGQVSNVLLAANTDFVYEISSNGTIGVTAVVADFSLPSSLTFGTVATTAGTCTSGAGTVSCDIGNMAGLSSETITITAMPTSVGVGPLTAAVSTTDVDERPINNQDAIQLTVDPAVDLVVNTPANGAVFLNASTTVSATLNNVAVLDATNVSLSIALESGLQASAATWSIGTCTVTAQQVDCVANTFSAQSSSTLSITATGTTEGRKDVTVTLSSAEAEANPGNNTAIGEVRVTSQNDDDDDGGGSGGPFFLVLLALTAIARKKRL